ncbi:MAG: isochorismatase family protein [Acidobacteria bacterium]|nr:isochorismatase family protein [Acidobacteriota bacterium]
MALPSITSYPLPTQHDLPPSRVSWRLRPDSAALLVHDMQGYFVRAFPADAAPMPGVIANIAALIARCDGLGIPVFYTAQPGRQDPLERGLQQDFWGPGMSSAPEDQHVIAALAPRPADTVLTKWRYSAFQRSDFEQRLRARGRSQLMIAGVFAHIGCLITAADAFMREVQPFLVADAVADFSRAHHDRALVQVAACSGVVLSTAQTLAVLHDSTAAAR